MKYRKKPVIIEAITFDELVAHGIASGAPLYDGIPWSFDYAGQPITHEHDDCHLIPTLEGLMKMGRGDMLITGVKGEVYPCKSDIFAATYEAVGEAATGSTADFSAQQAIERLGQYIGRHDLMPTGFEGGAVDCAIAIIKAAKPAGTAL